MSSIPAIESLLPHRGTMLLIDAITAWDAESASGETTPRADAWYAEADGSMPSWIGVELMAQTLAAHVGLVARSQGRSPKEGVLLGTRAYRATQPRFPAGETLTIHAHLNYRDDSGLGAYDCTISAGGVQLASATIKVFEPENFTTFLESQNAS